MPDYYDGIFREVEKEKRLLSKIYDWWDSLSDEEQYNLMLGWYPNEFTEDDDADDFFGNLANSTQLWIWKRENKLTEEDIQGQVDMATDMKIEERKLRGDGIE